jgi:hypothetical protein
MCHKSGIAEESVRELIAQWHRYLSKEMAYSSLGIVPEDKGPYDSLVEAMRAELLEMAATTP